MDGDLKYEEWDVKPEELALAGFYYTGHEDAVTCFKCQKDLSNWKETDVALAEHYRWSPDCQFIREEILKVLVSQYEPTTPEDISFRHT